MIASKRNSELKAPPTTILQALKHLHLHTDKLAEQRHNQAYCTSPPHKLAQTIGVGLAMTIGLFLRKLRSTTGMKCVWLHHCAIVELSKRCPGGGVLGGRGSKRRSETAG